MKVDIRPETQADHEAISEVHNQAFRSAGEGRLVTALRNAECFTSGMSLVAAVDNKIVGHVLFSDLPADQEGLRVAALAPVAVVPEFQGKGIGSRLINEGLSNIRRLGYNVSVVLGDPNYYQRFGFDRALGQKIACPYSGEHLMAIDIEGNVLSRVDIVRVFYAPAFSEVD